MQSSEQQPLPQATPIGASEETLEEEAPPLYEFAPPLEASQGLPQPGTAPAASVPEEAPPLDQQALEQAVRQGLIYPPPPSYYQNMSTFGEQPIPASPVSTMVNARPALPDYPPPRPAYPPSGPPSRTGGSQRSRLWIWIVVAVLSVGLVGCGLLGWGAYTIFNAAYQSTSGSLQAVDDFYGNLQSQNYQAAYSDLNMPNVTLTQFTQQARQADQENGIIQSYQPQTPSFGISQNAPDLSHFSYVVAVTRAHKSYSARISVSQEGSAWKITGYDQL